MKLTQTGQVVAWASIAIAVGVGLYFLNPATLAWVPDCPLHTLTGLNCPGCGATRAVYQLSRGHVIAALHLNPLIFALPVAAWVVWRNRPALIWPGLALVIAFGILRNIPAYPFTLVNP